MAVQYNAAYLGSNVQRCSVLSLFGVIGVQRLSCAVVEDLVAGIDDLLLEF